MKNIQVRPSVYQLIISRLEEMIAYFIWTKFHLIISCRARLSVLKDESTYHISYIPYTQLIPLHLLLQPIPGIFQIYLFPFPNLLSPVRNSPFFLTLSSANIDNRGHTEFQGARVQLNPGASIITSRLYWSSAGIPKKPVISSPHDTGTYLLQSSVPISTFYLAFQS